MRAAINCAVLFHAMTDDPALTMRTQRSHCAYRTLKAVEVGRPSILGYLKSFVVFVVANDALTDG